jgi:hypothetical protein
MSEGNDGAALPTGDDGVALPAGDDGVALPAGAIPIVSPGLLRLYLSHVEGCVGPVPNRG